MKTDAEEVMASGIAANPSGKVWGYSTVGFQV
jgi:hypothetical protein